MVSTQVLNSEWCVSGKQGQDVDRVNNLPTPALCGNEDADVKDEGRMDLWEEIHASEAEGFNNTDEWTQLDLYGRRCWTHVHRYNPCPICFPTSSFKSTLPPTSCAALRFPPEIIHRIVEMLGGVVKDKYGWSSRRPTHAALVCKHWADVCLHGEWVDDLRGRDHTMALRSLISASNSYLTHSITGFQLPTFHLYGKDDPWLHLVLYLHRVLPNHTQNDRVRMEGPLLHGLSTMRSIHPYLPRSMPPILSRGIRALELWWINFRQLSDLQHLFRDIPSLKAFEGYHLSWPTTKSTSPVLLRRRARDTKHLVSSPTVYMRDCTYNLEAVTLCAHPHDQWIFLRAILESLVRHDESVSLWKVQAESRYEYQQTLNHPSTLASALYKVDLHWYYRRRNEENWFQLRVLQLWQDLHKATLVLWLYRTPTLATTLDWEAVDEAVKAYPQIQSVVIGRGMHNTFREKDWTSLADADKQFVKEKLPEAFAAGKLFFTTPPPLEMVWEIDSAWPALV